MRAPVAKPAVTSSSPVPEAKDSQAATLQRQPRSAQGLPAGFIENSPRMVAQTKREAELFGPLDERHQLKAAPSCTGLPDNLKSGIESLSGMSMDHVNVHYNSAQPAQLQALAYAQGSDIHIASGQERHLPHEAWHVVQQAQGRVKPTTQMKSGVSVNDDPGLEREADLMGEKNSGEAVRDTCETSKT